jgi:hypothetical protein
VADLETTTRIDDLRVWAWGIIDVDNLQHFYSGNTIGGFINWIKKEAQVIYFHNLAFDSAFILDFLMSRGYTWVKENPGQGEFSSLIDRMGKFYTIVINFIDGCKVELRDSLKKLPMPVEDIAKAFHLEMRKGSIDYSEYREPGHWITDEELKYLYNDVAIVAQALKLQFANGLKALTVGADSLTDFKRITGRKEFRKLFPILSNEMDNELRKAYRGGFTYADPRFSRRMLGRGKVYDVNSLYPSVMYNYPIPVGRPWYSSGGPDGESDMFVTSITFTAKLKKDRIPCIQVKKNPFFKGTEYVTEIPEPVTLSCTNVDLSLWEDQYDLDILSYNGTFYFDHESGVFTEFIDKWMQVKANSVGGTRQIAKLQLNSLYGKFATNTDVTGKHPILDDNGIVKLVLNEFETRNPVYTPAGIFITSYARNVTIRAAQSLYPRFAYADTDSLHILGDEQPDSLDVHPTRLGAWKHEGDFHHAVYVRAKQYGETLSDGTHDVHIAGAPKQIVSNLTPSDLLHNAVWHGKLLPVRTKGGIVLKETDFTFTAD